MSNKKNYLYSIPISQRDVIEFGLDLDLIDMAIYELFKHVILSKACKRMQHGTKDYYQFTRTFIIQQLPILGIKTKAGISNRLQKLVKEGMLVAYEDNQKEGISYYCFGDMHYKVHDTVATKEVQKNDTPVNNGLHHLSNSVDTPIKNGLHYNNTIDNSIIDNKSINKKSTYGNYGFVSLTEKEAETYISKHGLDFFNSAVERLENWIGQQAENSKERKKAIAQNHYFTLNGWVQRSLYEDIAKAKKYKPTGTKAAIQANQKINLD